MLVGDSESSHKGFGRNRLDQLKAELQMRTARQHHNMETPPPPAPRRRHAATARKEKQGASGSFPGPGARDRPPGPETGRLPSVQDTEGGGGGGSVFTSTNTHLGDDLGDGRGVKEMAGAEELRCQSRQLSGPPRGPESPVASPFHTISQRVANSW